MFNKILVAIDRSPANREVVQQAISIAKANKARLLLLHVLSGEEEDSPIMSLYPTAGDHYLHLNPKIGRLANEIYHRQWKEFENQGLEMLRNFAKDAIAAGIPTEFSQITGHPSSTICDFALSCQADAIVIGRRGYSGLKEIFLGSVSNYVVHHAPCSVLLVRTTNCQNRQPVPEEEKSTTYSSIASSELT